MTVKAVYIKIIVTAVTSVTLKVQKPLYNNCPHFYIAYDQTDEKSPVFSYAKNQKEGGTNKRINRRHRSCKKENRRKAERRYPKWMTIKRSFCKPSTGLKKHR
jgi:hypothetical protein